VVLVSCTDSHSKANVNRSMKEALKSTLQIIQSAKAEGLRVRAYASLAFGCPFEGLVPEERVIDIMYEYRSVGADKMILADTLGIGKPNQVRQFCEALINKLKIPPSSLGLHLHDTYKLAHENLSEGWKYGIRDIDAAVGGCGGCNFAPGASGNISVEKVMRTVSSLNGNHLINRDELSETNSFLSELLARKLEN